MAKKAGGKEKEGHRERDSRQSLEACDPRVRNSLKTKKEVEENRRCLEDSCPLGEEDTTMFLYCKQHSQASYKFGEKEVRLLTVHILPCGTSAGHIHHTLMLMAVTDLHTLHRTQNAPTLPSAIPHPPLSQHGKGDLTQK
ncbi:unnamed protein product [Pleuronectes platessa]|uniref:Uncharacterized protein n=1 Tax=Pleuronectes platessa TaxID=8262 RepID=A0A9N7VWK4_PLEPL|nr:unnamed protein product [Pleuronectes platessa]